MKTTKNEELLDWTVVLSNYQTLNISGVADVSVEDNGFSFLDRNGGLISFVPYENLLYHGAKTSPKKETNEELSKLKEELLRINGKYSKLESFIGDLKYCGLWSRVFGLKKKINRYLLNHSW